jgi:hypothetical protein
MGVLAVVLCALALMLKKTSWKKLTALSFFPVAWYFALQAKARKLAVLIIATAVPKRNIHKNVFRASQWCKKCVHSKTVLRTTSKIN